VCSSDLYYGQVDKEFKEDVLGQEAKYKNALLSYYRGDFEWASEQLNILKTATSQLISNDAIELALIIQENTGLDTSFEAMEAFANAEFLLFQNKIDEALEILNLFPFKFSKHSLEDNIYFLKAKIFEKQKNYEKALKMYETVYTKFSFDLLADNAVFRAAEIHDKIFNNPAEAFKLYEKILLEFESSFFVTTARNRYRELEKTLKNGS
jgi:tetratricopeptide (TPR) repeat protein